MTKTGKNENNIKKNVGETRHKSLSRKKSVFTKYKNDSGLDSVLNLESIDSMSFLNSPLNDTMDRLGKYPKNPEIVTRTSSLRSNQSKEPASRTTSLTSSQTDSTYVKSVNSDNDSVYGIGKSLFHATDKLVFDIMVKQSCQEAKKYTSLTLEQNDSYKKELDQIESDIELITKSLSLEIKLRNAAYSLFKLHFSNKETSNKASQELKDANIKVEELNRELCRNKNRREEVEAILMEHNSAILLKFTDALKVENSKITRSQNVIHLPKSEKKEAPVDHSLNIQLTSTRVQLEETVKLISMKDSEIRLLKQKLNSRQHYGSDSSGGSDILVEGLKDELEEAQNTIFRLKSTQNKSNNITNSKDGHYECETKYDDLKQNLQQDIRDLVSEKEQIKAELELKDYELVKIQNQLMDSISVRTDLANVRKDKMTMLKKTKQINEVLAILYNELPGDEEVLDMEVQQNVEKFVEKVQLLMQENQELVEVIIKLKTEINELKQG